MPHLTDAKRHAIAQAIVQAGVEGDAPAAKQAGISTKTLRRYRKKVQLDPKLAAAVQTKQLAAEQAWLEHVPAALEEGIGFVCEAMRQGNPCDPELIKAVAEALATLSQEAQGWKMVTQHLHQHVHLHATASSPQQLQNHVRSDQPAGTHAQAAGAAVPHAGAANPGGPSLSRLAAVR